MILSDSEQISRGKIVLSGTQKTLLVLLFCLCTVSGQHISLFVFAQDSITIPAAIICIPDLDTCLGTNLDGYAPLPRINSENSVHISASGFQDTSINYRETDTMIIYLKKSSNVPELATITVSSTRISRNSYNLESRAIHFTLSDITATAGTAGDISRYIATLPSTVASIGEGFDNTLYVRGGRPTEILFLVDGIEFENINHFSQANGSGGPIGFINSDFISNVSFYPGNMPVEVPSRLSSVVDISMKHGSPDKFKGAAGIKLTGGMFSVEGPVANNTGSFIGALRYVDFTQLSKVVKDKGVPKLGDLFTKLTLFENGNLTFTATGLHSFNNFRFGYPAVFTSPEGTETFNNYKNEIERILQGGVGFTAKFGTYASQQIQLSTSFRNGIRYDSLSDITGSFFQTGFAQNPIVKSGNGRIKTVLKYNVVIPITEHDSITAGASANSTKNNIVKGDYSQYSGTCIECQNGQPVTVQWTKIPDADSVSFRGQEYGGFFGLHLQRGILKFNGGTRVDHYQLLDNTVFSPSLSLSVSPGNLGTFQLSYGIFHQFPTELPLLLFNDLAIGTLQSENSLQQNMVSLLKKIDPYRSTHYGLGFENNFFDLFTLHSNLYYKWYDREFVFSNPYYISILNNNNDGTYFLSRQDGRRKATGFELMIKNSTNSWYHYSLGSSVFKVLNKYSDKTWYHDWTDVGYTLNISAGCKFLKYHNISLSGSVMGGRPYNRQNISSDCIGRKFPFTENSQVWFEHRLDKIISVNARYACSLKLRNASIQGSIEIMNLLNQQPVLEYRFNGERFVEVTPFGFTPIVGVSVSR
jgi:hypothetical protein